MDRFDRGSFLLLVNFGDFEDGYQFTFEHLRTSVAARPAKPSVSLIPRQAFSNGC